MKPLNIIMLCMLLLIQGISQGYAAQMMSANSTSLPQVMNEMPCHEIENAGVSRVNDCCDQDCQCHTMASALIMSAFTLNSGPSVATVTRFKPSFVSYYSKSLYRPPIFA